jgi:hypothetical protein
MPKLTPDDPRFWKAHGISPKVRRRRGYHRYEKGDPEELLYAAWPDEVNRHLIDSKIAPRAPAGSFLAVLRPASISRTCMRSFARTTRS